MKKRQVNERSEGKETIYTCPCCGLMTDKGASECEWCGQEFEWYIKFEEYINQSDDFPEIVAKTCAMGFIRELQRRMIKCGTDKEPNPTLKALITTVQREYRIPTNAY